MPTNNVPQPYVTTSSNWDSTNGLTALATTTAATIKAAPGAGNYNYLDSIHVTNNNAVGTRFTLLSNGVVRYCGVLAVAGVFGCVHHALFDPPLRGVVNTTWTIQLETVGASVHWSAQGHTDTK